MASPDGHPAQAQGHDTIEFSEAPTPAASQQQQLAKQHSSGGSSSGADAGIDDKKASPPLEQYALDPERQSERVGSLRARSESEGGRGAVAALWHRYWKILAQLIAFKVFTASVSPRPHLRGVARACGMPG